MWSQIQRKRKDLRVIISSATLDAHAFKRFFETNRTPDKAKDTAAIVSVEGRQHAVEVFYVKKPVRDYVQAAVDTAFYIHQSMPAGDVLIFLSGQQEIDQAVRMINSTETTDLQAVSLYASLPHDQQLRAFQPPPRGVRKVVVATNVAETSVTIPGIVYVVDSGFAKIVSFNPRSGMEALVVTPISQANANQRAGRAGRIRAGKCFRLYTEASFVANMPVRTVPEMQRSNLASVVLQLKALGVEDVVHFDFMSPPHPLMLINAVELLYSLGALDENGGLVHPLGTTMAEFPVEPRMARVLLEAGKMGCAEEVLSICAMLSVQDVFTNVAGRMVSVKGKAEAARRLYAVYEGDHISLLNVFNAWLENGKEAEWAHTNFLNVKALRRASDIRKELRRYLVKFDVPVTSCAESKDANVLIRKCIVSGYFANAAQLQANGSYKPVRGGAEVLSIHSSSSLYRDAPRWVLYHDLVHSAAGVKQMRDVSVIEPMWLAEMAPHFYEFKGVKQHITSEQQQATKAKHTAAMEAEEQLNSAGETVIEEGTLDKTSNLAS